MAAENGESPKDKGRMSGDGPRTRPGVTLDLEAQAAPDKPPAADQPAAPEAESGAADETRPPGDGESGSGTEGVGGGDAPPVPMTASSEPAKRQPGVAALVAAGLIGGVVALALGYGLQMSGVLPSPGETAANAALTEAEELKTGASALDQRLTSIEAASAQSIADRALLDDLSRQVGVVDAFGESLSDRLLKAEASIAALTEDVGKDDTKQTLDALSDRVATLESAPAPAAPDDRSSAALAEMSKRVDALEETLAKQQAPATTSSPAPADAPVPADTSVPTADAPRAPSVAAAPPAEDGTAARVAALSAFRQAAAQGGSFSTELDGITTQLDIAPASVAKLKPLAEKGAPSRAELTAAFPGVADAILAAEPSADSDAGLLDRLTSYGRSLVKVRPAGSDPSTEIVARMKTAVEAGDFAEALAERKALPEGGQAASQSWADAVADRLEIDRLAGEIAASADVGGSG